MLNPVSEETETTQLALPFSWPPFAVALFLCASFALMVYYVTEGKVWLEGLSGLHEAGSSLIGRDFVNLWTAARLAIEGNIAAIFDLNTFHQAQERLLRQSFVFHSWSYPPLLLPWILGLGLLPYLWALGLWLALTFAAYAFAVAYKRPQPWGVVLVLALAPASFENISYGQNGFLSAALLVGGLRLLNARPVLAGALLGGLIFKPQLGLLLPIALLAGRHVKPLLAAAATATLLVALSIVLFGVEPWRAYFQTLLPFQLTLLNRPLIYEYAYMMPTPLMAARFAGDAPGLAFVVAAFFAFCAAVVVAAVFRRTTAPDLCAAVVLSATFLTTPYALSYDMTALSAAVVAFLAAANRRSLSDGEAALMLSVWLLPLYLQELNSAGLPLAPLVVAAFLGIIGKRAFLPFGRTAPLCRC